MGRCAKLGGGALVAYIKRWLKHILGKPFGGILLGILRRVKRFTLIIEARLVKSWAIERNIDGNLIETLNRLEGGNTLEYFRRRDVPLFYGFSSENEMLSTFKDEFFVKREKYLGMAEEICNKTFDLLGSGKYRFEKEIDWHSDFKVGYRWKPEFYMQVDYYDLEAPYDVKVPWELSRFQHVVTLGKAYWLSNDEKYAREFVSHITDWIEKNPPLRGVNWTCTMEVAIRVANWIWGYYFFRNSPVLTNEFLNKFLKSILVHSRYIINNLEYSPELTSNHYLSDIVGLVCLGVLFPEFKESAKWRQLGIRELFREMDKQIYDDGVDFEASIYYHRLVIELFIFPIILLKGNDFDIPPGVLSKLERMLEFVMYYTKPDGTAPQIGDADDGRLHILSDNKISDHRYLLGLGAVLFDRGDFKAIAGDLCEEVLWVYGVEGWERFKSLPKEDAKLSSRAFLDGGIYIMRRDSLYMIVDCGSNGQNGNGGHAHNDTLSFELYAYDKTFIVDPGTYAYTADYKMRNLFRSTAYHNVVMVDDVEMNEIDERNLFSLGNNAIPKVNRWETNGEYDFLDAEHTGYKRLKNPVVHRRQIYFDKKQGFWVIKDILTGRGSHKLDLLFHFAPMSIEIDRLSVRSDNADSANIIVIPLNTDDLSCEILDGWVSPSYGIMEPAKILKYSKCVELPDCFLILLLPYEEESKLNNIDDIIAKSENYFVSG
ncbi:MAG: alginate lyase family protein [bacterium]